MASNWVTNPPHEDRYDRSGAYKRRTYYDRHGVRVTDRWLIVADRRFRITELTNLRTARGPSNPLVLWASAVAGVAGLALLIASPLLDTALPWTIAVVFVAVPALVAATAWRTRTRHFELWADYHGQSVQVLLALDGLTYGQICRAIVRAREDSLPPPSEGVDEQYSFRAVARFG